jgi:hypothetical protein
MSDPKPSSARPILYCRCAYAQVVPEDVKDEVLARLADSGEPFEAVSDLCEMAARKDPALGQMAAEGPLRVVACHGRAVKWLFHHADAPLAEGSEVLNMREDSAEGIAGKLGLP